MCCIGIYDVTSCYGFLQVVVGCSDIKCVVVYCCMTSVAVVEVCVS